MEETDKQLCIKIHKEKMLSMEMCNKDCKEKECKKGKFCIDLYINFVAGKDNSKPILEIMYSEEPIHYFVIGDVYSLGYKVGELIKIETEGHLNKYTFEIPKDSEKYRESAKELGDVLEKLFKIEG